MLNLGPDKLIVIFLLALVLLGPEKLPGAARRLGEVMRVVRHYSDGFRQEMSTMVEHVTNLDPTDPHSSTSRSTPSEDEPSQAASGEPTVPASTGPSQGPDEHKHDSPSTAAETGGT